MADGNGTLRPLNGINGINGIVRWNGTAFENVDISSALPSGTALRAHTAVPGTIALWTVGQTSTSSIAITNG